MEIGDKYGSWTVIGKLKGRPNVLIRCECGVEQKAQSFNLKSGASTQCRQCAFQYRNQRVATADRDRAILYLFKQYSYQDKNKSRARRGIKFQLTLEHFTQIIQSDCDLCGKPPSQVLTYTKVWPEPFKYTTVDRIDSSGSYIAGNVRPLCWVCNKMRSNMSDDDFIAHISRILSRR